jgi:hypothetical protein
MSTAANPLCGTRSGRRCRATKVHSFFVTCRGRGEPQAESHEEYRRTCSRPDQQSNHAVSRSWISLRQRSRSPSSAVRAIVMTDRYPKMVRPNRSERRGDRGASRRPSLNKAGCDRCSVKFHAMRKLPAESARSDGCVDRDQQRTLPVSSLGQVPVGRRHLSRRHLSLAPTPSAPLAPREGPRVSLTYPAARPYDLREEEHFFCTRNK